MNTIYSEIFKGLNTIPATNSPGSLIITGNAKPLFAYNNSGDVILATNEFGKGKIFVAAHNCYLNWLHEKHNPLIKIFMDNIKRWLSGEDQLSDCKIANIEEIINYKMSLQKYKIVKWEQEVNLNDQELSNLLNFLDNGGSLFCGSTVWGYLQIYPNRTVHDMTMFKFLKDYFGIVLTTKVLCIPNELPIHLNKAKFSHFDTALQMIRKNPESFYKYLDTIAEGLEVLWDMEMIKLDVLNELREIVTKKFCECKSTLMPKAKMSVCKPAEKSLIKVFGTLISLIECSKAPGIEDFPGDFSSEPEILSNVELKLVSRFNELISTGFYLPAGYTLVVQVLNGNEADWSVQIGAHTDNLSDCDTFKRWPCITTTKRIEDGQLVVSSPYGGLIYFKSQQASCLLINLSNVVESPYFDLTKPETVNDWPRRKNASGLWAELAGRHIIFTTSSSCIRHLENPTQILNFWDKVVETHHFCRGTNPNDYRRERVVNDRQPSVGYMHAGYPIVTHMDCCQLDAPESIFNLEKLKEDGNWGLFHELGHNLQRSEWTFDEAVEVTVNIFSLHAGHFVLKKNILEQKWPRGHIGSFKTFFGKKPSFDEWSRDLGMALMTFIQLIKHFGWQSMYRFMAEYEQDIKNNSLDLPKTNQQKIDQWVLRYSRIVGKNIKPQFEMFGIPVSLECDLLLDDLELWCPHHEKDPERFFNESN